MLTRLLLLLPAVLLCVAGPVLAHTADRSSDSPYAVCNTACCTVQPNCSAALHVDCRCRGERRINLRRDSFPPSVETIEIYGVDWLELHKWALLDLTSLSWVKLQQIGSLTVHKNGVDRRRNASLASINIDSVNSLYIESGAFSGFWDRTASIKIEYIKRLRIAENAFSFRSIPDSPSLVIDRANIAHIASGAFNAPFSFLTLAYVHIKLCKINTFGQMIQAIVMDNVDINEIREDCIEGTGVLNQLSVVNSRLGIVRHRGIHGNISSVSFLDTDVKVLEPNGLHLHVDKLDVTTSHFNVVMQRGFHVLANRSICLHKVNVTKLYRNAFKAMKVAQNETGDQTPLHLHSLAVKEAQTGSLAFDKDTPLNLVRLSVRAPEPPVCPVSKWVRHLTGLEEMADLGPREQLIQDMLDRDWLCAEGGLADSTLPAAHVTDTSTDASYSSWRRSPADSDDLEERIVAALFVGIFIGLIAVLGYRKYRTYEAAPMEDRSARRQPMPKPKARPVEEGLQTDSIRRRGKPKGDEKVADVRKPGSIRRRGKPKGDEKVGDVRKPGLSADNPEEKKNK